MNTFETVKLETKRVRNSESAGAGRGHLSLRTSGGVRYTHHQATSEQIPDPPTRAKAEGHPN
jgi:hypothetical protein